jgi:HprK-related kinase B
MSTTLQEIADRLQAEAPTPLHLPLCFGGHRIDVHSNDASLIDRLRDYFSGFDEGQAGRAPDLVVHVHQVPAPDLGIEFVEWSREPGKDRRKEAFFDLPDGRIVHKVRTGMQFLVGDTLRVAFGDCLANDNQVVNFINFQYTSHLMNKQLALCHAAGILEAGRGIAIAGISGAGKSTLALHAISDGMDFASNDRLLVGPGRRGIEMTGVPKHPRINPGTALANPDLRSVMPEARREALEALSRDALWDLEEKYDARIDQLYGPERIGLHAPCEAFLLLTWSHLNDAPARFAPAKLEDRPDLLEAIMKSPGPFYRPDDGPAPTGYEPPDPGPYLEALAGLPVYEASGGVDFAAGVAFCRELLARHA